MFLLFFLVASILCVTTAEENVSTHGLQSCYCAKCEPGETVGKMFERVCYFLSLNKSFRILATERNKTQLVLNDYQPAVLNSSAKVNIFLQVVNEMKQKHFQSRIMRVALYLEPPVLPTMLQSSEQSNVWLPLDQSCLKFVVSEQRRHLIKSCNREVMAFLAANESDSVLLPAFTVPSLNVCSFDENAVAYISNSQCLKVMDVMEANCNLVHITNDSEFRAVHNYLMTLTQDEALNITVGEKYFRFYGIEDTVSTGLYSTYVDEQPENNCMFFDVGRKQIVSDQCKQSHKNLCIVSDDAAIEETNLRLDDKVLNTSTYGLRNCYCETCDPALTVGKMFRDTCYFITLEDDYKITSRLKNKGQLVNGTYTPAVVQNDKEGKVLEQIVNELRRRNRLETFQFGFFLEQPARLTSLLRSTPLISRFPPKCFVMKLNKQTKAIVKDCTNDYPVLLTASEENSRKLVPYTKPPFEICEFDRMAMRIDETGQCVKARGNNDCPHERINSLGMLESIHAYLMNLSQENAQAMQIWDQFYRIDTFLSTTLVNNSLYSIYVHPKQTSDCLFIDVLGKQIIYWGCHVQHRSLCVLENPVMDVTESPNLSETPNLSDSPNVSESLNVSESANVTEHSSEETNTTPSMTVSTEAENVQPKIQPSFLLVGLGIMTLISMIFVFLYLNFLRKK